MSLSDFQFCIVGAGLTGLVYAESIASQLKQPVLLIDKRNQLGGNSSASIDDETGIEVHNYGSHIFHTSNKNVWKYINQFTTFNSYHHHVLINTQGRVFFMPINLKTIQEVSGKMFTPTEAQDWISSSTPKASQTSNMEEKAISLIGPLLYKLFIKGYTTKQWGRKPSELPPDILTRIPVRMTYNTEYFNDMYQGIPSDGYGAMFRKFAQTPGITVKLNTSFSDISNQLSRDCHIIYTGMIDEFFDFRFGNLEWRSLRFETETISIADYQGTSVMNFGDEAIPYTRIHEFKHYHPEWKHVFNTKKTIICREYPIEWKTGIEAFYPVSNERNNSLLTQYRQLAQTYPNITFCGRLGSYQYWDMDKAIAMALQGFESIRRQYGR
jgi:UDP-galactopyranose mutase